MIELENSYKRYEEILHCALKIHRTILLQREGRNTVLLTLSQTRYWIVSFNRIVIRHKYGIIITVDPFSSSRAFLRVQHSSRNDILFIVERRRGGGPWKRSGERQTGRKRRPYVSYLRTYPPRNVTLPWANLPCKLADVFLSGGRVTAESTGENTVERSRQKTRSAARTETSGLRQE